MSSDKKKIVTNIAWLLTEHGMRIALGLIVAGILARQLGVERYGLFQYAFSLVAIFASISYICGAEVLIPALTNADDQIRHNVMGNAFAVRLFFSVLAYLLLLLYAFFTETYQVLRVIALIGLTILVSEAFGVVTAWLQSQTNAKPRSMLVMVALILKVVFVLLLWQKGVNQVEWYAMAYVLEVFVIAMGLMAIYKKLTHEWFFGFSLPVAYDLFRRGLPFFWGLVALLVFNKLDLIMLRKLSDETTLGHYAAALQLLNNINALAPILVMSLAPLLVYKQSDIKSMKKNVLKISLFMLAVAAFGALAVQFIAPYFIPLLFGDAYVPSVHILTALIWVSCLYFFNEGLNIYLIKMGYGHWVTVKWLLALMVALPAYWYLVPLYNAHGAIVSYAMGYASVCFLGLYLLFSTQNQKS